MLDLGRRGVRLIVAGACLMIVSWLLSLLMVIRVIQPNFLLIFLSFGMSIAGLVIGYVMFVTGPTEPSRIE